MAHRATIKSSNGVRRVDRSLVHPALAGVFVLRRALHEQATRSKSSDWETLEGIESTLRRIDQHLESANKMHGDLNRAAQRLINRESGD